MRDEVRRHAKRRRAQGATWEAISKETGLGALKLRVWCRIARATASVPALRPVEVVTEPEPTGLVVVAPSGLRVEGLGVQEAAQLFRLLG